MKEQMSKRWWSWLLLAAAVIVIWRLVNNIEVLWSWLGQLIGILTPFITGFVIAFLLYRPSNWLEERFRKSRFRVIRRPARSWSILLVYLALIGLLALMIAVIAPLAVQGVSGFIAALPGYYSSVNAFIAEYSQGDGLLASLNLSGMVQQGYEFVREHLTVENVIGYASGILSATSSLISVLIAFVISVYMLAGRESLLATVRRLATAFLPEKAVSLTGHYSRKASEIFTRYVYSMMLDALCICLLVMPGMWISGIPYPVAFAIFIGIANLIPYFGAIISGGISVLVLMLGGHWGSALFLAVYVLVAQQVDGNLIQPRIFGQSVGIKPIYVLLAITVGGGIGGFLGMLVGVPSMAVLQILVADFITHRNRVKRERAEQKQAQTDEESASDASSVPKEQP